VRTLKILATNRATRWVTMLVLLACLGACDKAKQPDNSMLAAGAERPAIATPSASSRSTFEADEAVVIATARDQAARAAREQTLRVQRQLVEQRRATRDAAQHGNGNERCIGAQRMRRVANGWVQAGAC
jgi:hypothetical protein